MNLSTNLIYDSEMRSPSLVSLKSMLQVAAIFFPLIIVILYFYQNVKLAEARSALDVENARWTKMQAEQERSQAMTGELRAIRSSTSELAGWERTRLEWHALLASLRGHVPPSIQLKVMNVRHALELDEKNNLQRRFKLSLNGRCAGPDADTKVQGFRQVLGEQPPLDSLVSNVVVAGLVEDLEPGAREGDRIFQIDIDFNPRNFREVTGR